jgi:hypothetical protein
MDSIGVITSVETSKLLEVKTEDVDDVLGTNPCVAVVVAKVVDVVNEGQVGRGSHVQLPG